MNPKVKELTEEEQLEYDLNRSLDAANTLIKMAVEMMENEPMPVGAMKTNMGYAMLYLKRAKEKIEKQTKMKESKLANKQISQ